LLPAERLRPLRHDRQCVGVDEGLVTCRVIRAIPPSGPSLLQVRIEAGKSRSCFLQGGGAIWRPLRTTELLAVLVTLSFLFCQTDQLWTVAGRSSLRRSSMASVAYETAIEALREDTQRTPGHCFVFLQVGNVSWVVALMESMTRSDSRCGRNVSYRTENRVKTKTYCVTSSALRT
jgi:hypothetical protein